MRVPQSLVLSLPVSYLDIKKSIGRIPDNVEHFRWRRPITVSTWISANICDSPSFYDIHRVKLEIIHVTENDP